MHGFRQIVVPSRMAKTTMTFTEIEVCSIDEMERESVRRFDYEGQSYAIYRSPEGEFFASDGYCTHERSHLADGIVMDNIIECSRHFGQFDYKTGEAVELPACIDLRTYPVSVRDGKVLLDLSAR